MIPNTLYKNNGQLELLPIPYNHAEKMLITSGLRFYSEKCSRIPEPVADKYFEIYTLLYWKGSHILENISAGTITKYNTAFKVIYLNKLCRGTILAHPDEQYSLSFRAPNPEWDLQGTVIISPTSKRIEDECNV